MIDAESAAGYLALEQVPAGVPILGDEVEVVARYVKSPDVVWEAKADEAAPDVVKLEGRLVLGRLDEGRVGLMLAEHAARLYVAEVTVDANGVTPRSVGGDNFIQLRTKGRVFTGAASCRISLGSKKVTTANGVFIRSSTP